MGFKEKFKRAIKKIKTKLIVYAVMMIIIGIIAVAPLAISIQDGLMASDAGEDFWYVFLTRLFDEMQHPFLAIKNCFLGYLTEYFKTLQVYLLISVFFAIVGIIRALPKHEFEDMENGSSDWCQNGEQYTVLNKNSGIVLAEKNYLPVDKRGNVNVLVVRRFWCW